MKKLQLLITCLCSVVVFYSCQKEMSFEAGRNRSSGSLQSEATGDCLPKTAVGIYEEGVALVDTSNFIQVQIDVNTTGSYTIYSDTVNGISFRSQGVFTATGLQSVKVKGSGTPFSDGITNFTIVYDSTACVVPVSVLASGAGGPASYTLAAGTGGACMNAAVNGSYVINTATNASNTVAISVNVTAVGTYTITTALSNSLTFSGSGSFATTGVQTVTLTASGTPTQGGPTTIQVTAGTSTCNFQLNVSTTPPPVMLGDYFPLTAGSNWSYEQDADPNDSLLIKVQGTKAFGPNQFTVLMQTGNASAGFDTSGYYRKAMSNYIQVINGEDYFPLAAPQWKENVFLMEDKTVGFSWDGASFNGVAGGFASTFFFRYKILQQNTTLTVKGITYSNVIVVEQRPFVTVQFPAPIGVQSQDLSSQGLLTSYFAKGFGLIKASFASSDDPSFNTTGELRRSAVAP